VVGGIEQGALHLGPAHREGHRGARPGHLAAS
jgi:hypothetical protein